ncbi:MAG: GNAT family N-acetyltransferase [Clostridia bacterium]|nr:GNAT family N-acetyltransferase [Clostridia bacterium]
MQILSVTEGNLREAGYVHALSWQESHRSFCTAAFIRRHTPEAQSEHLRREIAAGKQVFLMTAGGCPVGVVSVAGSLIENLYILPEYQNRGYGSQLLEYAIGLCSGAPTLFILSNNARAQRLYERRGFRLTGCRNQITDTLWELEMRLAP